MNRFWFVVCKGFFVLKMRETENISICVNLGCSACCQNVSIRLYPDEAGFLSQSGTVLIKQLSIPSGSGWDRGDGRAEYLMKERCANLGEDGLCKIYNDLQRPKACGQLRAGPGFLGIFGCNEIRRFNGLPAIRKDGTTKE